MQRASKNGDFDFIEDASVISMFPSVKQVKNPTRITIADFLTGVREGRWQAEVAAVRRLVGPYEDAVRESGLKSEFATAAKSRLDAAKERLPCVTLAGRFNSREHGAHPASLSGFVAIDLDGLPDPEEARRRLIGAPHIFAVWSSCSGRGLWMLVRLATSPAADDYSAAWRRAADHCARVLGIALNAVGVGGKRIFDPSLKAPSHPCFASHDPALWVNEAASGVVGEEGGEDSSAQPTPEPESCPLCPAQSAPLRSALGPAGRVIERMRADTRADERLGKVPEPIRKAYKEYFNGTDIVPGTRNDLLSTAAPALVRRLSFDMALAVLMVLHDLYAELWNDSRAQHEHEAKAALTNAIDRLVSTMPDGDRQIYQTLSTEPQRAAFRIMRDLARSNDCGQRCAFFLSENELAGRIGIAPPYARELFQKYARWEIISLLERGERRALGTKSRATRWRWLLTTEDTPFESPKQ